MGSSPMFVNNKMCTVPTFLGIAMEEERVGTRMKRLREARGWSQGELARVAKMHRSHIERIEDGSFDHPRPVTLKKLASALNCEVDELTGKETIREPTPYEKNARYKALLDTLDTVDEVERYVIVNHALWTAVRAKPLAKVKGSRNRTVSIASPGPTNVARFPQSSSGDFPPPPVAPEEYIAKDADFPRPVHEGPALIDMPSAAGQPLHDDVLVPQGMTNVLNTRREVHEGRRRIIRVIGDSMKPILHNGSLVEFDPARDLFQPGRVVMVYIKDEGSTIGLLAKHGNGLKLLKRNPDYGGPMEIILRANEYHPMGTATRIVDAPIVIE